MFDIIQEITVQRRLPDLKRKSIDVGPSVMLKRPAFWMYFIWAIALSAAGLALVSQASNIITAGSSHNRRGISHSRRLNLYF